MIRGCDAISTAKQSRRSSDRKAACASLRSERRATTTTRGSYKYWFLHHGVPTQKSPTKIRHPASRQRNLVLGHVQLPRSTAPTASIKQQLRDLIEGCVRIPRLLCLQWQLNVKIHGSKRAQNSAAAMTILTTWALSLFDPLYRGRASFESKYL